MTVEVGGRVNAAEADEQQRRMPIAVVGLACRLPGASGPNDFWRLLRDGVDAVGDAPADRPGHGRAGYLDGVALFDADFFGISPREAAATDPQQRMLLELTWEALEDAGTVPESLRGTRTAVFASAIWDDYAELTLGQGEDALTHHSFAGTRRTMLANRISHAYELTGPSLTVDTGQSSSLVAVHLACETLRRGDASAAVVGGVNLLVNAESTAVSRRLGALSQNGRCHTFDARADGYVRGEGGVVMILKPLDAAIADGDRVYGVLRGSAVNNDGGGDSLGVPQRARQEEVIRLAHTRAGTDPADVQYVELHGTGTPTGDPVEAAALGAALGTGRPVDSPLRVGSVKTNIGHLEGAAGIVGLLKTVLSIAHRQLPPSLNYSSPNPDIPLETLNLRIQAAATPWPDADRRLVAGVSAFGFGGTNCHVVVTEPPPRPAETTDSGASGVGGWVVWPVSGASPAGLRAVAGRLAEWAPQTDASPAQVGYALATSRSALPHRAAIIARDRDELVDGMASLATADLDSDNIVTGSVIRGASRPVLVFPGQGAQWSGMGLELAAAFPVFDQALDECAQALAPVTDWDLRTELAGDLSRVDIVQPALWAVMVSLARLWQSFGIQPAAVVGHSQGELAAAAISQALTLHDAARVVALRSQLIARHLAGHGGMIWLATPAPQTRELIKPWNGHISIAALNGPSATVVSGDQNALNELIQTCENTDTTARVIPVDYASHSAHVETIHDELLNLIADIHPQPTRIPFHSTTQARPLNGTELTPEYWYQNLRQTVQLHPVIETLLKNRHTSYIETSPHPVLSISIQHIAETTGTPTITTASLHQNDGSPQRFLTNLAHAWTHGITTNWKPAYTNPPHHHTPLPTYPFQREHHWLATGGVRQGDGHPLVTAALPLADGDGAVLTGFVSRRDAPWLADHAVAGKVLLPGTALVELAIRAGEAVGCTHLAELNLLEPLPVTERMQVQVTVGEPESNASRRVAVYSRAADADPGQPWLRHASGLLAPAPEQAADDAGLRAWPPSAAQPIDVPDLYAGLAERGYEYGPSFRGVGAAWRVGDEVFAEVSIPVEQHSEARRYGLHPALFDAALHGLLPGGGTRPALPFSWSDVDVFADGATTLRVRLTPTGPDSVQVRMADQEGRPVASVGSLVFRQTQPAAGQPGLFRLDWKPLRDDPRRREERDWRVLDLAAGLSSLPDPMPGTVLVPAPEGEPSRAVTDMVTLLREWLAGDRYAGSRLVVALAGRGVVQGAVAGLVRSAQTENPGRFGLVHLDDRLEDAAPVAAAALDSGEPEVRVCAGEVTVPRLVRADTRHELAVPDGDWRLDVTAKGTLANLAALPAPSASEPLAAGQVRVRTRAAGLNFRDVVVALDMVAGLDGIGQEAAGVVTEVGPGVTGFAPGDAVMGLISNAMAPVAVADARTLTRLPDEWTFEQGASVPVVFLTAWMGLIDRAGLKAGDRVLIHAATGGFGLAAIQVAQYVGAEVFATASPGKQHLLRELGLADDHIASTRTVEFRDRFLAATGGAGMDVVVNVLAGEFTDASLAMLPRGGRFIEMGKTDVRDPDAVAAEHPGVAYEYFDLVAEDPDGVQTALRHLTRLLTGGALRPVPLSTWQIRHVREAFELMQRAEHLGKIVFTFPRGWDPDGVVLITGGTGTLGRLLARHLVTQYGVRHLLLTSRRGPEAPGAAELVAELDELGAHVSVEACDVGDRESVRALLARVPTGRRLGVVIHAAGVLDDALVERLRPEQVSRVLRAKVDGARHLDELTTGADLDAFVLFSSVAGTVGTAGQANYAAANAYLDELARRRRGRGLPAVSVAWGLWQEASGMTGHMDGQDAARLGRTGVAALATDDALALFDQALAASEPALVAMRLDLPGLRDQAAAGQAPAVLRDFADVPRPRRAEPPKRRVAAPAAQRAGNGEEPSFKQRLADLTREERERMLVDLVRSHAGTVLRLGGGQQIGADEAFNDIGFDSLTSVELRNRLNQATGLRLPSTVAFGPATPTDLAARLYTELFPDGAAPQEIAASVDETDDETTFTFIGKELEIG